MGKKKKDFEYLPKKVVMEDGNHVKKNYEKNVAKLGGKKMFSRASGKR